MACAYELGVTGEYFNGLLNAGAAVFRLDQTNRVVGIRDQSICPGYPAVNCTEASGLVRSEGVDLELQEEITEGWQIGTGFTCSEAKYEDPDNIGESLDTKVPATQFKPCTRHTLSGQLNRWSLGGRYSLQSKTYTDFDVNGSEVRNEQEAFGVLDLALDYAVNESFQVQLAVNNALDEPYYQHIGALLVLIILLKSCLASHGVTR